MPAPLSEDLRQRVVEAVIKDCMSRRAAARRFGVSISSAISWVKRYKRTGSVAPDKMGGRRSRKLDPYRDTILSLLSEQPDITMREMIAALQERGIDAKFGALQRFYAREKITYKKNCSASRAGQGGCRQGTR